MSTWIAPGYRPGLTYADGYKRGVSDAMGAIKSLLGSDVSSTISPELNKVIQDEMDHPPASIMKEG